MSATLEKIPLAKALAVVEDFARLFPPACYTRWQVAGSVRRGKNLVGDLEFVVIPAFGDIPTGDMFGTTEKGNLLWQRLDDLVRAKTVARVETDATAETRACWGPRQRRILFRGVQIELYACEERNWGAILAIRTGPAGFSKHMVEQLRKIAPPHSMAGGYVRKLTGRPREQEVNDPIVECPTEETFFGMAGIRFVPPESRKD